MRESMGEEEREEKQRKGRGYKQRLGRRRMDPLT